MFNKIHRYGSIKINLPKNIELLITFRGFILWIFKPLHLDFLYRFQVDNSKPIEVNKDENTGEPMPITISGDFEKHGIKAEILFLEIIFQKN